MEQVIESQVNAAAKIVEEQVDAEINRLENLTDSDLDDIRKGRMQQMQNAQKQKQNWMAAGHGKYYEIADEPEFFSECKKSKNMVCHFFRESTFRCQIVDKHLEILARKHVETKFVKINAEKVHFLVQKLKVRILPTICLIRDSKTVDYILGFDDLGGKDDFSTEMMEWRIAQADVINYSGDLLTPPDQQTGNSKKSLLGLQTSKKTIKEKDSDDSDEDDW